MLTKIYIQEKLPRKRYKLQKTETSTATRNTKMNKKYKENDIMGIADTGIVAVSQDIKETTLEMIDVLMFEDAEIISIYYGQETSEEDAEKIVSAIEEKYPDVDVDLNYGGQPIYYYIISVE